MLDLLLEYGINHIDTAPAYGDSELRIGSWMDRHRKDFFLATKTRERDYEGAKASIHRSLERLRCDRIDLIQLHALAHPDEWEQAMGPGGALEAAIEARSQGLVRFIGVTGHGWTIAAMHRRSLARFDFDSVLMPWNWVAAKHPVYAKDFEATVKLCMEHKVAVQTIKAVARGPWAASMARGQTTWYQPLEAEDDIRLAVRWVLARAGLFLNSVGDVDILPAVLRAANEPGPAPSESDMVELAKRCDLTTIFGL
jgi:aryl-alcohol dehydrogenase-like predicted oxidoreductase